MLKYYRALARRLMPWRQLLLVGALLTAVSFIWQILFAEAHNSYLLPTLLTTLLLLCLIVLIQFFGKEQPIIDSRWRRWLWTLWYKLLALVFTLFLLAWLFLSLKALSALLRQHFF